MQRKAEFAGNSFHIDGRSVPPLLFNFEDWHGIELDPDFDLVTGELIGVWTAFAAPEF